MMAFIELLGILGLGWLLGSHYPSTSTPPNPKIVGFVIIVGLLGCLGYKYIDESDADWKFAEQKNIRQLYCSHAQSYRYSFRREQAEIMCEKMGAEEQNIANQIAALQAEHVNLTQQLATLQADKANLAQQLAAVSSEPNCIGDCTNGWGIYTFVEGQWNDDKYVGEYKDGVKNGQGIYTWANGDKYVGEWKDGNREGQGSLVLANGNRYNGEYKNDKFDGQGTYTWVTGEKHIGEWKEDKSNGHGERIYPGGGKYVGEFKDGKYNGQGTFTFTDGRIQAGLWQDGVFVQ